MASAQLYAGYGLGPYLYLQYEVYNGPGSLINAPGS